MTRALLTALALVLAAPAFAETVAITGGTLALGDGSEPLPGGTVVIRDGRVVAAGAGVAVPAGARVIDAAGKWVSPGIVAGFARLGISDVEGVDQTVDSEAEKAPFSAAIDVASGVNYASSPIDYNRAEGVTRAIVAPAATRAIFAGQGVVIDLGADPQAVMVDHAFQLAELGERGKTAAGGSRPAAYAAFRAALAEAQALARGTADDGFDKQLTRADAQALVPVVEGRMPLFVHVERASDILNALALRTEFPKLRLVIVGAAEGWRVARQLAAARVPVIASALVDLPASFETLAATQSNVGRMVAAGVPVSLGLVSDGSPQQPEILKHLAGNLVGLARVPGATGLSWGAAFAAITSRPAEALGLGGQIGSLKPGARADVVIWDGDPLELATAPVAVMIDGVAQPLTSRQSRLAERYAHPQEGALPKAYER